MADYRGGGLTNMKIREAEKLVENIRHNVEQKKKEAEGAVSKKSLFESSRKVGRKLFFLNTVLITKIIFLLQLGATINVLPPFSTNIPFYIK